EGLGGGIGDLHTANAPGDEGGAETPDARIGIGREAGTLLVAGVHHLQWALLDVLEEPQDEIAGNAERGLHAVVHEPFNKVVRDPDHAGRGVGEVMHRCTLLRLYVAAAQRQGGAAQSPVAASRIARSARRGRERQGASSITSDAPILARKNWGAGRAQWQVRLPWTHPAPSSRPNGPRSGAWRRGIFVVARIVSGRDKDPSTREPAVRLVGMMGFWVDG